MQYEKKLRDKRKKQEEGGAGRARVVWLGRRWMGNLLPTYEDNERDQYAGGSG